MIRITKGVHKMLTISSGLRAENSVQNNCQVVVIGKTSLLKAISSSELPAKLGVDTALFQAAIDQLPGIVPVYLNKSKIISVPDEASRHNSPSNANSIVKALQNFSVATGVKHLSVVLYAQYCHVFASIAAISKCFPIYTCKTDDTAELETIDVEVVITDEKELGTSDLNLLQDLSESIRLAGKLVDMPPNILHTEAFLAEAVSLVEKSGLNIQQTIIKGDDLQEQGFGGIFHVGKAATTPPIFAVFSHTPASASQTYALVGKGITFDTGGLQIKSRSGMPSMKCDMGGAAAVFAAFLTLVKAGFQQNLHCLMCVAENAVSLVANKPDDIITLLSGKTCEINNTDAEGRLVLADGVFYAKTTLKADTIIDMATLTGAQSWATGKAHAAILTNKEETEAECILAGKKSGDLVHPLPFCPDLHFGDFKSTVADFKNSNFGEKEGPPSAIAGLFIAKQIDFSEDVNWLHVDIASPAWDGKRGTGFGTALLVSLLAKHTDVQVAQQ